MDKSKWMYNKDYMYWFYTGDKSDYNETEQAQSTSRLLDGSSDCRFWQEYKGTGEVDGLPVCAVYLLDHDQSDIEEEGDYDWVTALNNGRLVLLEDKMTDDQIIEFGV